MKFKSALLIEDLKKRTQQVIKDVEALKLLSVETLNKKLDAESWSALECIEHIHRYAQFYTSEISQRLELNNSNPTEYFKSGWLGNYFAKMMLPSEKMKKMNTFKDMNPNGSDLDKSVLDDFLDHQYQMLELLEASRKINLAKTRTSITISNWITLRLGDTFRVVIYHNQRHLVQAQNVLKGLESKQKEIV